MARPPLSLVVIAALFAVAMVWLVAASSRPRAVPTFSPDTGPMRAGSAVDTVTIDARDPQRWRYFSVARGPLVPPDSAGWDLAFRRFRMMPAGDATRIDTVTFDELRDIPSSGYQATVFGRDSVNPAIERWYRYDWFSHLLRPKPEVYVIRTGTGQVVKLEVLSYYCPGPEPGCVTVRFASLP